MNVYLFLYNAVSMVLWCNVLYLGITHYLQHNNFLIATTVGDSLYYAQSLAVLELVHSLTGLVRSPFITAFIQVLSRIFCSWLIVYSVPETQQEIGYALMVMSWATVEIPRYLFYAFKEVGYIPYVVTWVRYSLFAVLYPSGISGELYNIVTALSYIKERSLYSITMPNAFNFSFDYYAFCIFVLVLYVPGSPFMYKHMVAQRKKVLSGLNNKDGDKKKKQ